MYSLNRKTRYEIIRELINKADTSTIRELVNNSGFYNRIINNGIKLNLDYDDIEYRRKELIDYLDEMEKTWEDNYTDMTDRQFIKIEEPQKESEKAEE